MMIALTIAYLIVAVACWPVFAGIMTLQDTVRYKTLEPDYVTNSILSLGPAAIWPVSLPIASMALLMYLGYKRHKKGIKEGLERRAKGLGIDL